MPRKANGAPKGAAKEDQPDLRSSTAPSANGAVKTNRMIGGPPPYREDEMTQTDGAGKPSALTLMIAPVEGQWGVAGPAMLVTEGRRPAPRRRGLLTLEELLALPDPEWLVKGVFQERGLAVIGGKPGTHKSRIALDLSLAIIHGADWRGISTKGGSVVYVAAEGGDGLKDRVEAWKTYHGDVSAQHKFWVFNERLNIIRDPRAVDLFLGDLAASGVRPALVVIDTLASCMIGGDENHPRDMGQFVHDCDCIKQETGAAVLVVHHTDKMGKSIRGSSVLEGAADTILMVTNSKDGVRVHCEKQREAPEPGDMWFTVTPVCDSCIVTPADPPTKGNGRSPSPTASPTSSCRTSSKRERSGRPANVAAMTDVEFKAALNASGLSLRGFAKVIGIGAATASDYLNGKTGIPEKIAERARARNRCSDNLLPSVSPLGETEGEGVS
jgi:hypothetical protein